MNVHPAVRVAGIGAAGYIVLRPIEALIKWGIKKAMATKETSSEEETTTTKERKAA